VAEHLKGTQTKQGIEWIPKLAGNSWLGGLAARPLSPFFVS